jgi:hypothetical protein
MAVEVEAQTKAVHREAFLRLNCTCGKATYIHEGDKVRCSRCNRAARFLWGNSDHTFMGMKGEK